MFWGFQPGSCWLTTIVPLQPRAPLFRLSTGGAYSKYNVPPLQHSLPTACPLFSNSLSFGLVCFNSLGFPNHERLICKNSKLSLNNFCCICAGWDLWYVVSTLRPFVAPQRPMPRQALVMQKYRTGALVYALQDCGGFVVRGGSAASGHHACDSRV